MNEELKKRVAIFAGGFILGGLLAWGLTPAPVEHALEKDERLHKFVDQNVRAYGEAKTPEEKIHQADELYKKAVVLFLVDLGINVQGLAPEPHITAVPMIDDSVPQVLDESDPGTKH